MRQLTATSPAGGDIVVDVDRARDNDFIELYQVSGNISTGDVETIALRVEAHEKCAEVSSE